MERARVAVVPAFFVLLLVMTATLVAAAPMLQTATTGAVVTWPTSTLVISEVQTGGASASDEFVEIANTSPLDVDLAGMELVYVTSTGGTITRKASWPATMILGPGRHLLLANTSGAYASVADGTYSGGFAATGGSIVLRLIGGAPIDAISWGDATNAFVEGTAASAPGAGQSLERLPGGTAGNTTDTNANGSDWFLQTVPNPQNVAAPPVPVPAASPSPTPAPTPAPTATSSPTSSIGPWPDPTVVPSPSLGATLSPTSDPSPTAGASAGPTPTPSESAIPTPSATSSPTSSPAPTPSPTPVATPSGSPSPLPSGTPAPTPSPVPSSTPAPTPSPLPSGTPAPTPSPLPSGTPAPTPTATPAPTPTATPAQSALPIVDARALPKGTVVWIEGTLTTDLPSLESGHVGFIQDDSAGIAIYLDAVSAASIPAGTGVRLTGTIDERYGALTIRVATSAIENLAAPGLPAARSSATGAIGEDLEGLRVVVAGLTVGSATSYADGLGYLVDDGTGQVRVIVGPIASGGSTFVAGTYVVAEGPVGQRDSTGTGSGGYRIHATLVGEFLVATPPSPSPSPAPSTTPSASPTPSSVPTPSPGPTPSPTATSQPSPTPAPSASILSIAEVRAMSVGSRVSVVGVVIAEAGRLGAPPVITIADATGGVAVRLPDGVKAPVRGRLVLISGATSAPYGQLEIRPSASGVSDLGVGMPPDPLVLDPALLGENVEGQLVAIVGTQAGLARRSATGDISLDVIDRAGVRVRVMADSSSGITTVDLQGGATYRLVGIVGQRATKRGALDGYRIWLRDRSDIVPTDSIATGPGTAGGADQIVSIAAARLAQDARVVVLGAVVAGSGLLDSDGRRIVIEDATGGIEVLLPATAPGLVIGNRLRVGGTVGRAWGAPRLTADAIEVVDAHADVAPARRTGLPGEADEWQLVRMAGTVTKVIRLGDRWKADLRVGAVSVLVVGLAGSEIPSTMLVEGRSATITGFIHRPYPTATDRRWALTPRGTWDIALGPSAATGSISSSRQSGSGAPTAYVQGPARTDSPADVDVATLPDHAGLLVRVGGLIETRTPDGFILDDGTGRVAVHVTGEATAFLDLLHRGDAIGLVGRVQMTLEGPRLAVDDPAGVVRLGGLGEVVPIAAIAPIPPLDVRSGPFGDPGSIGGRGSQPAGGWALPGAVAVVLLAALVMSGLRQRQVHRQLVARVTGRLVGLRSGLRTPEIR